MKSCQSTYESLHDFSDKCRICLKNYSDMIDIFGSGISDQMMEVIHIKIASNDRLPKKMCQNCNKQLEKLHKFQMLAKDSDNYLRTLLLAEESYNGESQIQNLGIGRKRKRKLYRGCFENKKCYGALNESKDSVDNLRDDKMYLILVNESSNNSGAKSEICIKDLDIENENLELIDVCRSLVKSRSNEHAYSSEKLGKSSHNADLWQNIDKDERLSCENKLVCETSVSRNIYKINLVIYQCDRCEEAFESQDYLLKHLTAAHQIEVFSSSFNFWCPICSMTENDKSLFLGHLRDHKEKGFLFLKVDKTGKNVPLMDIEEEIFEVPKFVERSNLKCRIFKMNTTCYTCVVCKKLESISAITEHLKGCFPDFEEGGFHVKYTCPACCDTWVDDVDSFKAHLMSHRKDNVFFVKVNASGQPDDLTVEDAMFTTFEKALETLTFSGKKNEEFSACDKKIVIKLQDICSCHVCDYEASSVNALSEHYLCVHGEVSPPSNIFCPVCGEEFKFIVLDERVKFYSHLTIHKDEGIYFLKVRGDGTVVNNVSDGLGLFSDVNDFFTGKVPCPELEYIADIFVPEVFVQRISDVGGYLCDLGQGNFSTKQDIVNHLKLHEKGLNRTNRAYMCEKCGRKCSGKGNYKRHFLTHTRKSDISGKMQKHPKCSVCAKAFSNRAALNEHKKHHQKEGAEDESIDATSPRVICEICGKRLSNNASLAKHRKRHAGNKESTLLKCKICERGFRRESALNRHVSAHLNPNYFECEVCKLPLPSFPSLERHKVLHDTTSDTFDCKVCKVSFLTKDRLVAHQTHTGHHQDRKRFECNVCHERFFVGREFSQHIKMHPKYKMSECTLCGKRLSTMQSLMLHLGRHFESNSILCPHCGKRFFEERNYHRHLLTHKGVKPFACDVEGCKKSFYTYFELNRHIKYHNNTRDFNCPYCPKSFHEANHLKVHIRTHTGERPYTCPHCNKGFVTRTRCKQHINLIHQGVGCDLIQSSISKKVAVYEALEKVA